MTFAPAAPLFALPPRRSHLPPHTLRRRPRRLRPSAAAVIHNALSTEKLSTSLLAALCKTFSPSRLRTRIYNISFARRPLPGSVRAAVGKRSRRCDPWPAPPSAGWGRAKAKADAPSRSAPHFPRLPPRPRRLNGHPASAGGRENDRMAHRRTAPPTHRTPRGNDTCTIRVPRRKGAQSVVHNL